MNRLLIKPIKIKLEIKTLEIRQQKGLRNSQAYLRRAPVEHFQLK